MERDAEHQFVSPNTLPVSGSSAAESQWTKKSASQRGKKKQNQCRLLTNSCSFVNQKCLCVFKSGFCVIWKYTLANRLAKSIKSDFGSINWHARLKTSLAPYCLWEGSLVIASCSMPFINWPWYPACSVTALHSSQKGLVIHKKALPSSFFPAFPANRSLLGKLFYLLCLLES